MFQRMVWALLVSLACFAHARAQAQQQQPTPAPSENYVTEKGFRSRVFEVRHRDPRGLASVLGPLGSGFKGAMVRNNDEFRTITVRDFPENIAVIEETIRRLDTPEAARPAIEFRVHLLVASNDETAAGRLPAELADVVRQLQPTLGYRNFSLMGSQVVRGKEGPREYFNKGVADLKPAGDTPASKNPVYFNYHIRAVSVDEAGGRARVHIEEFSMDLKMPLWLGGDRIVYETVGFKNPVSLREGERVVAGTTSVADKSVVVVLSASTTK